MLELKTFQGRTLSGIFYDFLSILTHSVLKSVDLTFAVHVPAFILFFYVKEALCRTEEIHLNVISIYLPFCDMLECTGWTESVITNNSIKVAH